MLFFLDNRSGVGLELLIVQRIIGSGGHAQYQVGDSRMDNEWPTQKNIHTSAVGDLSLHSETPTS